MTVGPEPAIRHRRGTGGLDLDDGVGDRQRGGAARRAAPQVEVDGEAIGVGLGDQGGPLIRRDEHHAEVAADAGPAGDLLDEGDLGVGEGGAGVGPRLSRLPRDPATGADLHLQHHGAGVHVAPGPGLEPLPSTRGRPVEARPGGGVEVGGLVGEGPATVDLEDGEIGAQVFHELRHGLLRHDVLPVDALEQHHVVAHVTESDGTKRRRPSRPRGGRDSRERRIDRGTVRRHPIADVDDRRVVDESRADAGGRAGCPLPATT